MRARTAFLIALPAAAFAAFAASRASRTWGTSAEDLARTLPGDDTIQATIRNDRAIDIDAAPAAVWPWIAQLGQDKAGFYSYELLENLAGCEIRGVEHVVPAWQNPQPGDPFPLAPELTMRVIAAERDRHLVASSDGGTLPAGTPEMHMVWAFVIVPLDGGTRSRLHVRESYAAPSIAVRSVVGVVSAVSMVMSARMLRTIKRLAEKRPA